MRKMTKRAAIITTAAVVAVGGAGAAYAAWNLNSSHYASTVAGHASPITVSNLAIVGTLTPGAPVTVQFDAANTNSFPVKVTDINFSGIHTSSADCSPTNLIENTSATLPDGSVLSFNPGDSRTVTFTNALKLVADPPDACQNATFAFNVDLVAQSNASQ